MQFTCPHCGNHTYKCFKETKQVRRSPICNSVIDNTMWDRLEDHTSYWIVCYDCKSILLNHMPSIEVINKYLLAKGLVK